MWRRFTSSRGKFVRLIVLSLALILAACSQTPDKRQTQKVSPQPAVANEVSVRYQHALDAMKAKDYAAAETALAALNRDYPDLAGPQLNLGIVYAQQQKTEQAENAFKAALNKNSNQPIAWHQLGLLYRQAGRFSDAEQAYKRAVVMAPDYAAAHRSLGILYDLFLQQPDQALRHYQQCQQHSISPDPAVALWIKDLEMRTGRTP